MAKDPICEMEVDQKEAKKKGLTLRSIGETFYFCSKECMEDFKKDPTYTPRKCTKCMKKCDLKETLWKINHKGVLYCFCSEKCKSEFQKKEFGGVIY